MKVSCSIPDSNIVQAVYRMGRELQALNHNQQLAEWSRRVEACRNSGQRVSQWCGENGVAVSTYYAWQRKVFQAATAKTKACFAEVPVYSATTALGSSSAVIHAVDLEIELCSGVDGATVRAIIQALKTC